MYDQRSATAVAAVPHVGHPSTGPVPPAIARVLVDIEDALGAHESTLTEHIGRLGPVLGPPHLAAGEGKGESPRPDASPIHERLTAIRERVGALTKAVAVTTARLEI